MRQRHCFVLHKHKQKKFCTQNSESQINRHQLHNFLTAAERIINLLPDSRKNEIVAYLSSINYRIIDSVSESETQWNSHWEHERASCVSSTTSQSTIILFSHAKAWSSLMSAVNKLWAVYDHWSVVFIQFDIQPCSIFITSFFLAQMQLF